MPDRRESPGRRDHDLFLTSIADQFRRLEDRVDRALERMEVRVDELQSYHLQEEARMAERFAQRAEAGERLSRWSLRVGIASGLVGIAGAVIALVSS